MHDSDVFWASLFTRDGNKADKGGSRVPKARKAGGANTPFSTPTPTPPTPPSPAPLPTSSSSLSSLLFFSECTANCKTCQGNFCSVCEQGHALYKGSGRFGKGRCLRKCPKGYKTGVNPSGGEKCVRCKYHNLCSIYLKTAVTRYQAPIYWPLWSPNITSLWPSNEGLSIAAQLIESSIRGFSPWISYPYSFERYNEHVSWEGFRLYF